MLTVVCGVDDDVNDGDSVPTRATIDYDCFAKEAQQDLLLLCYPLNERLNLSPYRP